MKLKELRSISLITLIVLSPLLLPSCDEKSNTVPSALFTINPPYGNVDTVFVFNASEVHDLEDPTEELQVRWDWESDSIFDTEFTTTKIAQHKFATGGTFYITLEVKDSRGMTARKTDFVKVSWNNRPPNARFTVNPETGFLQDVFLFDASGSSDIEDNNKTLEVRWDFEGDGSWDTDFLKEQSIEHQYEAAGNYTVSLQVKDSEGLTDEATFVLVVGGLNTAPAAPEFVAPSNADNAVSTRCLLEWSCTDPENDELLFDVYFGTTNNPAKVASDLKVFSYKCLPLEFTGTYYWKVVAKDPYEHVVSSEVWEFTTHSAVNPMSVMTDPRDGKKYKTVEINGRLWMAQNLNAGVMINSSNGGDRGDGYQKNNGKNEKYCYANKEENCAIYGGLYQWDEAIGYSSTVTAEGVCPPGWHIPNADEWRELMLYYKEDLGLEAGENLAWGSRSGFEMLYSGYLIFAERKFYDQANAGYLWSSTVNPDIEHLAMLRSIYNEKIDFQEDTSQKVNGVAVRCLKNY